MTAPTQLNMETEVRELFEAKIREFAAFCAEHWTLTEYDLKTELTDKSPDYAAGYNAALTDGVKNAAEHWLDERQ